jgi:hypothetical protein
VAVVTFFRSTRGRVFGVLAGFALIVYGAMQVSLAGLILMMVGIVPTVTGLASLCLSKEAARARDATETVRGRTGDRRA